MPVDVALPCATQNELDANDAATLIKNGVVCVAEGANMPSTIEAAKAFEAARRAVRAGQGQQRRRRGHVGPGDEPERDAPVLAARRSRRAPAAASCSSIHEACLKHGRRADGSISYVDGANVAGFVKVADAMLAQGVI